MDAHVEETTQALQESFSMDGLSNLDRLELITILEQNIKDFLEKNQCLDGIESIDPPLTHHFSPSVYGREMLINKGSLIVGKTHRHAHLNIISKGKILVATEYGVQLLESPCSFISEIGIKRAVFAIEDTIWTTIHPNPTDTQDLSLLEDQLIVPDGELIEFRQNAGLEWSKE